LWRKGEGRGASNLPPTQTPQKEGEPKTDTNSKNKKEKKKKIFRSISPAEIN
jgi:hypothetical protein